jgi:D-sedoheptulose 7-phosphate isomerase
MNLTDRVRQQFAESAQAKLAAVDSMAGPIAAAAEAMAACLRAGGKVMACGNGGSAADSQHFAAELLNRFEKERAPLAGIALTTDTSTLTSIANDYAYEQVFAKQVLALGRPGDILLAISTSGNSPNVLAAMTAARERGVRIVALTGKGGGKMAGALGPADIHLCVPAARTARIQEIHLLTLHCLCDGIDAVITGDDA